MLSTQPRHESLLDGLLASAQRTETSPLSPSFLAPLGPQSLASMIVLLPLLEVIAPPEVITFWGSASVFSWWTTWATTIRR